MNTTSAARLMSWTDRPTHRRWAEQRFARLIEFVLPSIWHEGGFAYLDGSGQRLCGSPAHLATHSA
jgi:hypothetical protein